MMKPLIVVQVVDLVFSSLPLYSFLALLFFDTYPIITPTTITTTILLRPTTNPYMTTTY